MRIAPTALTYSAKSALRTTLARYAEEGQNTTEITLSNSAYNCAALLLETSADFVTGSANRVGLNTNAWIALSADL
jgi:hypothetical protein